jgi:cytochrome bd-type quinol oxidase subunit 1
MSTQYPVSTVTPTIVYEATIYTVTPTNTTVITPSTSRKVIVWSVVLYSILIIVSVVLAIFFGTRYMKESKAPKDSQETEGYDGV